MKDASSRNGAEREVVLLSKKGCHLCEAVEAEIRGLRRSTIRLRILDIDEDPALRDKYWLTIPVVRLGGVDVFDARMMDPSGDWKGKLTNLLN
jgi:Glutaredoxin-like domain (DUF836)